jgi:hypothetical protein
MLALVSGNMGTAARHRDAIAPFIFIFSAIPLSKLFHFKKDETERISGYS